MVGVCVFGWGGVHYVVNINVGMIRWCNTLVYTCWFTVPTNVSASVSVYMYVPRYVRYLYLIECEEFLLSLAGDLPLKLLLGLHLGGGVSLG